MSDNNSESDVRFDQFQLSPAILTAIKEVGYETPSPIQAASIPPLLEGRDLLGQAQTGTGKTAAFSLPLLSRLDPESHHTQLLVLAPTRELAIQVSEAMQKYANHIPNFHVLPVYGGQSMSHQLRQLKRGVQVVVGTPGRILDHLDRGSLNLSQLSAVVLDEADEMLRMGFIDDVDDILHHTPDSRQVALFSATMPEQVRRIALRHLKDPEEIKIKSKTATVEAISQHYWVVRRLNKLDALTRILEVTDFDAMIIFVRTKISTEELANKLAARGYGSAALNGDLNQQQREKTVESLKQGKLDIIVATDVAARGLDVPRISHVVNYDVPHDVESYVHRIGRTGRAGRKGEAILFIAPREQRMLRAIEHATRQKVSPMQLPTRDDIVDRRINQFKQALTETLTNEDLSFFKELLTSYELEQEEPMVNIAAALAFAVQREQPLQPNIKDFQDKGLEERSDHRDRDGRERKGRDRDGRDGRERRDREPREPGADMRRFRIDVGRDHGVQPKHVIGAIANEIDLDSQLIQNLDIRFNFSLVDLPDSMSKESLEHLKRVRVCGRKLDIAIDTGPNKTRDKSGKLHERKPRAKKKGGKPPHAGNKRSDRDRGGRF